MVALCLLNLVSVKPWKTGISSTSVRQILQLLHSLCTKYCGCYHNKN